MVTRADVVREARSWKETPFHHQGRMKGVGVDCVGVVIKVAQDLGLTTFDADGYGTIPNGRHLRQGCTDNMDPIPTDEIRPGDVLLMRWERFPQHLAVVTEGHGVRGLGVVHSYSQIGKCIEHGLSQDWLDRVVQAYRLRGLED